MQPLIPVTSHYYGDIVRKLFLTAAVIMFMTLPFLTERMPALVFLAPLMIVGIGLLAGLTSPLRKQVATIDTIVSIIASLIFEYFAIGTYNVTGTMGDGFFLLNEALAIIFLLALYYSTKTMRAMVLENNNTKK